MRCITTDIKRCVTTDIKEFFLKQNKSVFKETFLTKNSNKPIRVNNHHLYMDSQKEILGLAKDAGFILKGKSAMTSCTYEYQYLYYLQRPF